MKQLPEMAMKKDIILAVDDVFSVVIPAHNLTWKVVGLMLQL